MGGWVGIFVKNVLWSSRSGKVVVAGEVGEVMTRTGHVAAPSGVCWMSPWLMTKESRQSGGGLRYSWEGRRVVEGRCVAERRMLSTLVGGDVVVGRERDRDDFPIEESDLMVGGQFPLPHNSPRIHVQDFFLHVGREIVYCNSTPIGFGA